MNVAATATRLVSRLMERSVVESYENRILQVLRQNGIKGGYFSNGTLYVPERVFNDAGEALEAALEISKLPPMEFAEEDYQEPDPRGFDSNKFRLSRRMGT